MIGVKKFEPKCNAIDFISNLRPVCPYCQQDNEPTDLEKNDGETTEIECDHCGKVFMYKPNVSVTYDTIPYENWYIDKRTCIEEALVYYKNIEGQTGWIQTRIKMLTQEIEELDKEAERILQGNQRGEKNE